MSEIEQSGNSPALLTALKRLLRPLVRLLIQQNMTLQYVTELLKGIYVEVAMRHFRNGGEPLTNSRISVMTGVHRKDIKRLLESMEAQEPPPRRLSISAKILGIWQGDPKFLAANGEPLPLARYQFDSLVARVSTDIRPRTILDEWERTGMVLVVDDKICLNATAMVPSENFDELAHYFGRNLQDHIAAAAENLSGEGSPHFERAVFYSNLTPESVEQLRLYSREQATRLLQQVNREALKLVQQDEGRAEATQRFRLGAYFYREEEQKEEH